MRLATREETARINQASHAEDDQSHNRENQVKHSPLGLFNIQVFHLGRNHVCRRFAPSHRPKIDLQKNKSKKRHNGQQGIKIERDRLHKKTKTIFAFDKACYRCSPGTHRRDNTNRSRRSIDQVGKFFMTNLKFICNRTHHAAHRKAVEIIIHKNQNTKNNRRYLCTHFSFDM